MKPNDNNSLVHTTWNCKYHRVFAPKYRRKIFYEDKRFGDRRNTAELCKQKNVEILEAEACIDHIHMLVSIPPYLNVAQFMGFFKGKSSLIIFERYSHLKYKYGNRQFWCRGYYIDTAGKNAKKIAEYIQNQLKEDQVEDQMTMKEYIDPFTGSKE